jgi:hypothetical protein
LEPALDISGAIPEVAANTQNFRALALMAPFVKSRYRNVSDFRKFLRIQQVL